MLFAVGLAFSHPSYGFNPEDGLVAWYPFDGNASDMSGNGNHGTVHGASLGTDRHGVANRVYSFDGVDDWIDFNTVSFGGKLQRNQDYSIILWLRLSDPYEYSRIFNNYSGGSECLILLSDAQNPYNLFVRDGSDVSKQIGFGVEEMHSCGITF